MFDIRDQCDPERLARAIRGGVYRKPRLEVWSQGRRLTSAAPMLGGSVKASWVTGLVRHLDVTVPPVAQWEKWLALPVLEFRPYNGIQISSRLTVEIPEGRFPYQPAQRARPSNAAVQIQCDDYWTRIVDAGRPAHLFRFGGRMTDGIAVLIEGGGLRGTEVTATSTRVAQSQLLDKTRADVIAEWCASIGAEAFVDRLGVPQVADARTLGTPTTECLTGDAGSVGSIVESFDLEVFNLMACWSSAQGVEFPEQVAQITNPFHPAHKNRIGKRRKELASPFFFTREQAMAAATSLVVKEASRARTVTYTRLSDPTTDPGDSLLGQLTDGSTVRQQVADMTTPLGAGPQTIVGVATELDL